MKLDIDMASHRYTVTKKSDGAFEINGGGFQIEFPCDAVVLRIPSRVSADNHEGATLSVKWGSGHRIHFVARMPIHSAEQLKKAFPEIELIRCSSEPIKLIN